MFSLRGENSIYNEYVTAVRLALRGVIISRPNTEEVQNSNYEVFWVAFMDVRREKQRSVCRWSLSDVFSLNNHFVLRE